MLSPYTYDKSLWTTTSTVKINLWSTVWGTNPAMTAHVSSYQTGMFLYWIETFESSIRRYPHTPCGHCGRFKRQPINMSFLWSLPPVRRAVCAAVSGNVREWKDSLIVCLWVVVLHWYSAHRKCWVRRFLQPPSLLSSRSHACLFGQWFAESLYPQLTLFCFKT